MTVAYLTHDAANAATASELGARLGLELIVLDIRQTAPHADRLVCDLDHLPPDVKAGLLTNARNGVNMSGVAVHSYHLSADEVQWLRSAGAAVGRRLTGRVLAPTVPSTRCG